MTTGGNFQEYWRICGKILLSADIITKENIREGVFNMVKVKKIVKMAGKVLCMAACAVAPMASEICRCKYYQPKEPDGFEDFVNSIKDAQK